MSDNGKPTYEEALQIIDDQAQRIAWLEGMLDIWRCPVHGDFGAGSAYDGEGGCGNDDDCSERCERISPRRPVLVLGRARAPGDSPAPRKKRKTTP